MKIIMIVLCLVLVFLLSATIINVPTDQPTIQAGINSSVDADTVLIQPGTYLENINYFGKLITVASLFLTMQDTTYISQTIINGRQLDSVVKFENGEDSTAVLTGFTITNGSGGGIYCLYSNPNINNVIITGNYDPYSSGGGIFCYYSSPSLSNVTISNNSTQFGGGIFCYYSSPNLINVTIRDNTSDYSGGGIYFYQSSSSLTNVTISGNIATDGPGGIYCHTSNLILENVIISDNYGGGIYCSNSNPSLINVVISDNYGSNYCGGIWCNISSPILVNCILWNNLPQEIYFSENENPNSITISYSDIQGGESGIVTNNNGTVNWLEGNIDVDPLFVGTGDHPFMFQDLSPCIDTGIPDTTGLNLPLWDIIGNHRIWDGDDDGLAIIDMGAYEYGSPPYVEMEDYIIVQTPEVFLHQNYPNPFNPTTTIEFSIQIDSQIELSFYNIKGQKIKTIANNEFTKGNHSILWNGTDNDNKPISSGVYLYKLNVNGKTEAVKKCLLLK